MEPISKEDVEKALDAIDKDGIPSKLRSTGYCLVTRGHHYPPKHTLRIAHDLKTNDSWPGWKGGKAVNTRLKKLGYAVEKDDCRNPDLKITD